MSQLPQIDSLKAEQRTSAKIATQLAETVKASANRESQLELLAEALRDERDDYKQQLDEANQKLKSFLDATREPVADISSLP